MLPILFQSNNLIIYSYPLLMGLGWGIAYQIYFGLLGESVPRKQGMFLYWGIFLSSWIGAKVLFYLTLPSGSESILTNSNFWLGGGFVFYGGLLGGMIFLLALLLLKFPLNTNNFWPVLPALTMGHAIGRIGCLLAGCCFGKETDFFWGIFLHGHYRHPTQLLEALFLFGMSFHLLKSKKPKAILLTQYFCAYGVQRFIIEMLRGDAIRGYWWALTPSQWISIFLVVLGVTLRIYYQKNPSKIF